MTTVRARVNFLTSTAHAAYVTHELIAAADVINATASDAGGDGGGASGGASGDDDDARELKWTRIALCAVLFAVIALTIVGNLVVLVAPFYERRLRNTLIYFIMNLAATDLLVAVMAMSFYTISLLLGECRHAAR